LSLTLSTEDVVRLQSALTTLLSPLDSTTLDGWGVAAMCAAQSLLGADRAVIGIPKGPGMWAAASDSAGAAALGEYLSYYNHVDVVLRDRRRELGLEVYHRDMLYRPGELGRDELHNDWCVSHRLYDTLGTGVELSNQAELPTCSHFYHESASATEFGGRGNVLLDLLLPAFKAGVHTQRRLAQHRASLLRLVDNLETGLEVFDDRGASLHQNSALSTLLALDSEAPLIRGSVTLIALALSRILRPLSGAPAEPAGPVYRVTRTAAASYRLMGTVLGQDMPGPEITIAVSVERLTPEPLSDAMLVERYRLTPRELQVAHRIGQGDPSAEIARALGISRFTARHHAENVMRKLEVHSRAAVAARLTRS
jgi:DNA-binding CsgD family transcriptional regulator